MKEDIIAEPVTEEPKCRPYLSPRVRMQTDRITGKSVLLYPEGVLMLNSAGEEILHLCDGTLEISSMIAVIADRHLNIAEDTLSQDVHTFLHRLQDRGFIEWK